MKLPLQSQNNLHRTGVCLLLLGLLASVVLAKSPHLYTVDHTVMVPFRYIAEWVGASVSYHPETISITSSVGDRKVKITVNNATAQVKEKDVWLGIPATMKDWMTYVPLAFAADALQTDLSWDDKLDKVTVTHPKTGQKLVLRTGEERTIFDAAENGSLAFVKDEVTARPESVRAKDLDGATALHLAVRAGNLPIVDYLLAHGAEVNAVDQEQLTPLHYAVNAAKPELVRFLISKGANVNAKNLDLLKLNELMKMPGTPTTANSTPLHEAIAQGLNDVAAVQISRATDVNVRNAQGKTPLFLATEKGSLYLVQLLLQKNADVNIADNQGNTALYAAIAGNHQEIAKELLAHQADINAKGIDLKKLNELLQLSVTTPAPAPMPTSRRTTTLHTIAIQGLSDILAVLVSQNPKTPPADLNVRDEEGYTPLQRAIANGHENIALQYLQWGADVRTVTDAGLSSLHLACIANLEKLVKLLVEQKGAPIDLQDQQGATPLVYAVQMGNGSIAAYLIAHGASIANPALDTHKLESLLNSGTITATPGIEPGAPLVVTPLQKAAGDGLYSVVRLLLDRGAKPDELDSAHATALHYAVANGSRQIVDTLLAAHADPNIADIHGMTPLFLALQNSKEEIALDLLRKGASPAGSSNDGTTPLHWAIANNQAKVTDALLAAKAPVDARDKNGVTPLMIATHNGQLALVKTLLAQGADATLKDSDGLTLVAQAPTAEIAMLFIQKDPIDDGSQPRKDWSSMHLSAASGKLNYFLTMMMATESSVNAVDGLGRTPLHVVSSTRAAKTLLKRGAMVNAADKENRTPLHLAVLRKNVEVAKFLIVSGAYINIPDSQGRAPLFYAIQQSALDLVTLLVDKGGAVYTPDKQQLLPMHLALAINNTAVLKTLLAINGAVGLPDPVTGGTPLHWAALHGDKTLVETLLKAGAYVNAKDNQGYTPLHWAALGGRSAVIPALIENYATIDAKANNGATPYHLAVRRGWMKTADVLKAGGADVSLPDPGLPQ